MNFTMTPEQHENLLAMRRAHNAEAALTVAALMGIYVLLLLIYLCRYSFCVGREFNRERSPPTRDNSRAKFVVCCGGCKMECVFTPESAVALYKKVCCGQMPDDNVEESSHEEIPMTSRPPVEIKGILKNKIQPLPV